MKKKLAFLLALPLALAMVTSSSFAAKPVTTSGVTVHDVYEQPGASAPIVEFYDPALAGTAPSTSGGSNTVEEIECDHPDEVCYTEYVGTTYEVVSNRLKQYDYGPVTEQLFLISVAKGQTHTLSSSVTKTSTVKVDVGLTKKVTELINFSLTASYTGTVSKTFTTTDSYSGPTNDSVYNSRNFYAGAMHDLYEVTIKRTDKYNDVVEVYGYGNLEYRFVYPFSEVSYETHDAQKPKIIMYSQDVYYN